ncbi:MAG: hypothetical protein KKF16_08075 [Euryarchaeota archaeon]|nr:hypothetical protein [Euryarchaeota archaeon]MBU4608494.1 hypothetical protein [Euryarchaeota archaeon]MBV1729648.1 hypothetical protein [Methanobacterium sp.]MBV1755945.1 hypothetical protein [Methanobacterium sp.]
MDDKGLIFTTDAVLALAIFMVFSAAFISYYMVPGFAGQDQQSLDAIAADALRVMQLDGTLTTASTYYAQGETAKGDQLLRESLDYLIPSSTGYKLTLGSNPAVEDNRGLLVANDVTSRVEVVSAPQEGWMGRAWYKLEEAEFEDQKVNVTTTLWNFHNWLRNFDPYKTGGLRTNPYWGYGTSIQAIPFSIPLNSDITGAYFILGSYAQSNRSAFDANVVINNITYPVNRDDFIFLNFQPNTDKNRNWNYRGIINHNLLNTGSNEYYVHFRDIKGNWYDLPWFSIIGNYTTTYKVPKGVIPDVFHFADAGGLAVPSAQNISGNATNEYGIIYDLHSDDVSTFTTRRVMHWPDFSSNQNLLDDFDDGIPFVITDLPSNRRGSAVSVIREFDLPRENVTPPIRILDATVTMNIYGATDNAMVEVWDGNQWRTIFCSNDFQGVQYSGIIGTYHGYGNMPGTIYIPTEFLREGHNKVRITAWDRVAGEDFDLAGLVDSYVSVSYTKLPILWDIFPFRSFQSNNNVYTQELGEQPGTRRLNIREGAKEAYLFLGTGMDTRTIRVEIHNGWNWVELYPTNTTIPYYINLASFDADRTKVFTTGNSGNYTLIPGEYRIRVTATGAKEWESGDYDGTVEIFSGTRVAILYPEFLENMWTVGYSSNASAAQQIARQKLEQALIESGIPIDYSLLKTEALYTGDLPNNIPVRLDLWRQ